MSADPEKYLIAVVGPTASGKTSLAIQLAIWLNTDIISADSRQFFREMNIGTAKPSAEELTRAPHHFIDTLSIEENYDVGQFEKDVLEKIGTLFTDKKAVILAGGSGLYCKAVWEGLDEFPEVGPAIREELIDEHRNTGLPLLLEELQRADPDYYATVDRQNPQRIIRALEIIRGTGKAYSYFRNQGSPRVKRGFHNIKVGLEMPREELYTRIDLRMDQMIEKGLFEEARRLVQHRERNALQTVGYSEIFRHFDGDYDYAEAVRLLKRNSRRYAKRQLTWFRKDPEIEWFDPRDPEQIKEYLSERMKTSR